MAFSYGYARRVKQGWNPDRKHVDVTASMRLGPIRASGRIACRTRRGSPVVSAKAGIEDFVALDDRAMVGQPLVEFLLGVSVTQLDDV